MRSCSQFKNSVFRYRSIDALLGEREELERQTVYFAPPEKLNDPIEGLRQFYWRGDRITWRNFLRNYVTCLQGRLCQAFLTNHDESMNPRSIPVFLTPDSAPSPLAKSVIEACIEAVEDGAHHAALLDFLAGADRNIGRSELRHLLHIVHFDWLKTIHDISIKRLSISQTSRMPRGPTGAINAIRALQASTMKLSDQASDEAIERLYAIPDRIAEQFELHAAYNQENSLQPRVKSVYFEFPREYLSSIINLIYSPWYVACFSARHDNPAMWSYYADSHKGCCLVFHKHPVEAGYEIRLSDTSDYGSNKFSKTARNLTLDQVNYDNEAPSVEFFRNISRLSVDQLRRYWFQDDDGNTSPIAEHLNEDRQEAWKKAYWASVTPPLLRKHTDWKHEQEFRVLLLDNTGVGSGDGREFTYDYDTLAGIIFGINTSLADKVKIMRIVNKKLTDRNVSKPFKFYQAQYDAGSGRIEARHLSVISP